MRYIIGFILICGLIYAFNYTRQYRSMPKNETKRNGAYIKRKSILRRLLIDLPKQHAKNRARRNKNAFTEQGLVLFQGKQGQGKTLSMVKYAIDLKRQYKDLYICSNMKFTQSEKIIQDATDIIRINKGETGAVILIDEIQMFWNSKNSLNLDESITGYITTMRKNRRLMLGTCQNFYMISKDLRTQTRLLCDCITPLKLPLTIVVKKEPIMDSMGECKKMKFKGIYFYVHDDNLYNSYDTEQVIKALNKKGLKARQERANNEKVS